MRKKVSDAERRVEQWKAENNVFDSEGQVLSEKQLARLMEQTVTARNATSEARAKYEQAQKLARAGDPGNAIVEVLQSHTVRLVERPAGQRDPQIRRTENQVWPEASRNPEGQRRACRSRSAAQTLKSNAWSPTCGTKPKLPKSANASWRISLNQLKDQQVVSKDTGVELKQLEREAATSKQLFEALLTRYKQTAETQGFQLPDVRIIEKADAPQFPASPKRKQLVLIAAAGGLVLGLGAGRAAGTDGARHQPPGRHRTRVRRRASVVRAVAATANGFLSPAKAVRLVVAEPSSLYADAIRSARRELDMRRTSNGTAHHSGHIERRR